MSLQYNMTNVVDYSKLYTPKTTKEIYSNHKQINDIKSFLTNYYINPKKKIEDKILLILGPSGSCKTTICQNIFKESNYEPIKIDLFSNNNMKDNILQSIQHNTLDCFFSQRKKILFLDDIDLICQYEKTFSSFIVKLIKISNIPIICTTNNLEDKKISEIKKKATKIYISKINHKDCFHLLNNIIHKEKLNIELDLVLDIIKKNKNDIRLILTNLGKFINTPKIDNILLDSVRDTYDDINNINNIDTIISTKDLFIDHDLFAFVRAIYKKQMDNTELTSIVENDSSLISLLLHENILTEMNQIKKKATMKKEMVDSLLNILKYYTLADSFEKYIYINNDWYLYEYTNILKISSINNEINSFERNIKHNDHIFTQLLTKSSLRFNFKKKKRSLFSKLYNDDTSNTDYIFQLILTYIRNLNNSKLFDRDDIDCITKYAETFHIISKDERKNLMIKNKN